MHVDIRVQSCTVPCTALQNEDAENCLQKWPRKGIPKNRKRQNICLFVTVKSDLKNHEQ